MKYRIVWLELFESRFFVMVDSYAILALMSSNGLCQVVATVLKTTHLLEFISSVTV